MSGDGGARPEAALAEDRVGGVSLAEILDRIPVRPVTAAWLSGSLVEGLGNPGSDIDVYLLVPELDRDFAWTRLDDPYAVWVTVLEDRRIDYEYWPLEAFEAAARRLEELPLDGEENLLDAIPETERELIHRLLVGRPLLGTEAFDDLRSRFDAERFRRFLVTQRTYWVDDAFDDTVGLLSGGDPRSAALRARDTVGYALDVLLHALGSTNTAVKYRRAKLEALVTRRPDLSGWAERWWRLETTIPRGGGPDGGPERGPGVGEGAALEGYVEEALRFSSELVELAQDQRRDRRAECREELEGLAMRAAVESAAPGAGEGHGGGEEATGDGGPDRSEDGGEVRHRGAGAADTADTADAADADTAAAEVDEIDEIDEVRELEDESLAARGQITGIATEGLPDVVGGRPRRRFDVRKRHQGGRAHLVQLTRVFGLQPLGEAAWDRADGDRTGLEIAARLAAELAGEARGQGSEAAVIEARQVAVLNGVLGNFAHLAAYGLLEILPASDGEPGADGGGPLHRSADARAALMERWRRRLAGEDDPSAAGAARSPWHQGLEAATVRAVVERFFRILWELHARSAIGRPGEPREVAFVDHLLDTYRAAPARGELLDRWSERFGLRSWRFDPPSNRLQMVFDDSVYDGDVEHRR